MTWFWKRGLFTGVFRGRTQPTAPPRHKLRVNISVKRQSRERHPCTRSTPATSLARPSPTDESMARGRRLSTFVHPVSERHDSVPLESASATGHAGISSHRDLHHAPHRAPSPRGHSFRLVAFEEEALSTLAAFDFHRVQIAIQVRRQ